MDSGTRVFVDKLKDMEPGKTTAEAKEARQLGRVILQDGTSGGVYSVQRTHLGSTESIEYKIICSLTCCGSQTLELDAPFQKGFTNPCKSIKK